MPEWLINDRSLMQYRCHIAKRTFAHDKNVGRNHVLKGVERIAIQVQLERAVEDAAKILFNTFGIDGQLTCLSGPFDRFDDSSNCGSYLGIGCIPQGLSFQRHVAATNVDGDRQTDGVRTGGLPAYFCRSSSVILA